MKWAVHKANMGAMKNAYKIFVGRPEGSGQVGRPRHSFEGYNIMDLWELGFDSRVCCLFLKDCAHGDGYGFQLPDSCQPCF
jgi:hypothetical protein